MTLADAWRGDFWVALAGEEKRRLPEYFRRSGLVLSLVLELELEWMEGPNCVCKRVRDKVPGPQTCGFPEDFGRR